QVTQSGGNTIKHFVDSLKPFEEDLSVQFIINEIVAANSSIGVAYKDPLNNYVSFLFSSSASGGVFRKIVNVATPEITINTTTTFAQGDVLKFKKKDGVLSLYKNGQLFLSHQLSPGDFSGNLFFVQLGFLNYIVSTELVIDPVRKYVK